MHSLNIFQISDLFVRYRFVWILLVKRYIRDFSILKRNANWICPNDKLYLCVLVFCCELSELGELRPWGQSAASETIHKGFLNPLWEMQTFVSPALCTEQIPEEGDGLTEFLFPKQTSLKKANGDINMTSYCGWFFCKMVTDDTHTHQPTHSTPNPQFWCPFETYETLFNSMMLLLANHHNFLSR